MRCACGAMIDRRSPWLNRALERKGWQEHSLRLEHRGTATWSKTGRWSITPYHRVSWSWKAEGCVKKGAIHVGNKRLLTRLRCMQ